MEPSVQGFTAATPNLGYENNLPPPETERGRVATFFIKHRKVIFASAMAMACNSTSNVHLSWMSRIDASMETNLIPALDQRNYDDLLKQLRKTAATGHPVAEELLGVLLLGGPTALQFSGVDGQRNCEALAWFDRAGNQGSSVGRAYRQLFSSTELAFVRGNCLSFRP